MGRHEAPQDVYEVKDDAADRSWRTLWQQLAVDLIIAVVLVLYPLVTRDDFSFTHEQMNILIATLLKTVAVTVVSYFYRLYVAPKAEGQISLKEAKQLPAA